MLLGMVRRFVHSAMDQGPLALRRGIGRICNVAGLEARHEYMGMVQTEKDNTIGVDSAELCRERKNEGA